MNFLRPLSLLLETLSDGNPEIVMYCTATLANIAMTVDNHMQVCLIMIRCPLYCNKNTSELCCKELKQQRRWRKRP